MITSAKGYKAGVANGSVAFMAMGLWNPGYQF